jgi:acyl-coenzyme A thioesterase PaaI-like protein
MMLALGKFEAKPEFLNPIGTVQGGILTAMLENTMGPAAPAHLGGDAFCQTLELETSFLRPARPGDASSERA